VTTFPRIGWLLSVGLLISIGVLPLSAATNKSGNEEEFLPRFNPEGGIYTGRLSVRLDSTAPDGVVRFTVDGSEPGPSSAVAKEPFGVVRSTLVRARVFDRNGKPLGPSSSRSYSLANSDVAKFNGNLPVVVINSFGQEVQHDTRKVASIDFLDVVNGRCSLASATGLNVRAEVWWRGNSSLRYLKRSFGVKVRDDTGKSRSESVLGFPADSDWVLYAPYPDKTLIRDVLAYELFNQMGRYASRTRFVEVFLNETGGRLSMDNYMGVYVLEEKIKRSPARINIQKLGTNDNSLPALTGGYVFKKDHGATWGEVEPTLDGRPNMGGGNSGSRYGYPTGPGGFPADPRGFLPPVGGERAVVRPRRQGQGPVPLDAPIFQRGEGEVIVRDGGRIFLERGGRGPGGPVFRRGFPASQGWPGRAAEEAFMTEEGNEFYYVEPKEDEITRAQKQWLRNHLIEFERVLHSDTFNDPKKGYAAYIDADSFIDFHLIVEVTKNIDGFRFSTYYQLDRGGRIKAEPIWDWNLSFGNANGKQGWMAEHWYWPQLDDQQYSYYRRLFEDPDFGQRYVDRWAALRKTVFSDSNLLARIDAHVKTLGEARVRNFGRWPILGRMIWPNHNVGQTYGDEIQYLKDWTLRRLAWIDAQFTAAPGLSGASSGGTSTLSLSAPKGEVYYTTDGSDPRAPGGKASASAAKFRQPIPAPPGVRIMARAVFEERWSPLVQSP
jgi:hypothetical protein